ncbi:selenocysteine-specific translation elongation factor, partial [bacterium]
SIVDVPGHEKFVKTMVAGAFGIDMVLFIVAADEGVMPQTREHLDICSLLGVPAGVVALTKIDMVDAEMAELAREDVSELVKGTFLENAPVVPVSAVTGEGIELLKGEISKLADSIKTKDAKGLFRLPVDRVFTMKGFGTVVTGTLLTGSVKRDDDVVILPSGKEAKVRGAQVHGETVDKAYAGSRTALNLSGVGVDEIDRGDIVAHPGEMEATYMVDARLRILPSAEKPLKDRQKLRLHISAREVPVTVSILGGGVLEAGGEGFVQLRSREKFIACPSDRFVLRGFSPARTVGGGTILDHRPSRHKGKHENALERLEKLGSEDAEERLKTFLELRRHAGLTPKEAQAALLVTLDDARNLLQKAVQKGWCAVADRKAQRHVSLSFIGETAAKILSLLGDFHRENPLRRGMGVGELRSKFPSWLDEKIVQFTIERLIAEKKVDSEGDFIFRSDFKVSFNEKDEGLRTLVMKIVRESGFEGPTVEYLAEKAQSQTAAVKPVASFLVAEGELARTKEGFYFEAALMDGFIIKVRELLAQKGEITIADVKELTGASRKYTIPLAEFLDSARVTMRKGEVRVAGPKGRVQG